ncbi:hypothetical protein GCM10023229_23940 [Flavisolibacter ginsenosidimutans]
MAINLFPLLLLSFSFSCTSHQINAVQESAANPQTNDTLVKYVDDWKKDSVGCLKLRTREKGETIIRFLKKDSVITKATLYQNLGTPNEVQENNDNFVLIYYFDCLCKDGSLVKDADKCYAKFYTKSALFTDVDFICE